MPKKHAFAIAAGLMITSISIATWPAAQQQRTDDRSSCRSSKNHTEEKQQGHESGRRTHPKTSAHAG